MATNTHDAPALPPLDVDVAPLKKYALLAAVVGAAGYVGCGLANWGMVEPGDGPRDFFLTYLAAFVFTASLPIGAVGLSCIGFMTGASWGVVLRRTFQASIRTIPLVALLFVPVAVGLFAGEGKSAPFWWADDVYTKVTSDGKADVATIAAAKGINLDGAAEAAHKVHDYLNKPFFIVRAAIYFCFIGVVGYVFGQLGVRAEEEDSAAAREKRAGFAAPAMIAWAVLTTFMVTDWVMSVEPTWASAMFPVVFGMNSFITAMAFGALVVYTLTQDKPALLGILKDKFRIDLGSLLFGFTMVWAYGTFCQYMLIWAANLPEEIAYYRKRTDHGWEYLAYFLMGFHWLCPFVIFLFREVKTDPKRMRFMCVWLLVVCAADVIWWIVPSVPHESAKLHLPMGLFAVLMTAGAWALFFALQLGKKPIFPANAETRFLANWGHHH